MTRPISQDEAAVLERTLQVGLVCALSPRAIETIEQLRVTATCKCGCATVWFGPDGDAASGIKAAEACGTWNGETIDVIVWAIEGEIVGLEVAGPGEPGLPEPASVRSYEECFQRRMSSHSVRSRPEADAQHEGS